MSLIYQADARQGYVTRPGIYIGGKLDAKNKGKLKQWNVTHILNVTPPKQAGIQAGVANYFEGSFTYKRIPVLDNPTSASEFLQCADSIVDFIATALCHGSVLVHCQHGVSRSTTAVIFYLLRRTGKSLQESLSMIQRRRPQAQPIPAFLSILRAYEASCSEIGAKLSSKDDAQQRKAPAGPALPTRKRPRAIGPALPKSALDKDTELNLKSVEAADVGAHNEMLKTAEINETDSDRKPAANL